MKRFSRQLLTLLLAASMVLFGPAQAAELSADPEALPASSSASAAEESGEVSAPADASPAEDGQEQASAEEPQTDPADDRSESEPDASAEQRANPESDASQAPAPEQGAAESTEPSAPAQTDPDPADTSVTEQSEEQPEPAEHLTVRSSAQLADFLAGTHQDDYFQEAVVDTKRNRVVVDGQRSSVEEAFGPEADSGEILDSPEAAEAYFEETPYEAEVAKDGKVHVTAPMQTCRIVVEAQSLPEDYGAETVVRDAKYHQTILQFPDQTSTAAAYKALSGRYDCYVDEVLFADDALQDTETWGKAYMKCDQLLESNPFPSTETIQVAVIDSGCQTSNTSFFGDRRFSTKSKCFVDDGSPFEDSLDSSHGTHVAGIVHSCTPSNVELMILRIYGSGSTTLKTADTAVKYALENGADVINFSSAQFTENAVSLTAMDDGLALARQKGVPVVCAAGNYSQDVSKSYPACEEDAIAVSAINKNGEFAATYSETPNWSNLGSGSAGSSGSAYGEEIDFCGPGVNVVSAVKTGTSSKNGTSMSAPHITAAFAWLKLADPAADWDELYEDLKACCTDLTKGPEGEDLTGWDEYYGWGCPDLSQLVSDGHVHQWVVDHVVAPGCTTGGYTVYKCSECKATKNGSFVAPDHNFDDNGVCTCGKTRNPSCGENVTWSYDNTTYTLTLTGSGVVDIAAWENLYDQQFIRWVVLDGVTGLGDNLFQGYTSLKQVSLGSKLQSMGQNVFSDCTALKQVTLPASLRSIGDGALSRCTALKSIDNESRCFSVSDGLLLNKDGSRLLLCAGGWTKTSCTVPEGVTAIAPHAFEGVAALKTLYLPTTLTELGENALANCTKLNMVYARSNVTTLADNAFSGVTAAVSVSQGCTGWENKGDLGGTLTWTSYPGNLGDPTMPGDSGLWTMSLNASSWSYTGVDRRPGVILTHGQEGAEGYQFLHNYTYKYTDPDSGEEKSEDANHSGVFTHTYANNVGPAYNADPDVPPTVTITGKNQYYGSRSMTFSVLAATPVPQSAVSGLTGVDVSWESVDGASAFQLLRKKEGDTAWKKLSGATTTGTSYTDTTAASGTRYSYTVCALNAGGHYASRYQSKGVSTLYLAAPTLSSAQVQEDGSVLVAWSASAGAAKYQLLHQDSAGAWQQIAETTATSAVDTSPLQGSDNRYTVRAVAADGTESAVRSGVSTRYLATPAFTLARFEDSSVRLSWSAPAGAERFQVTCQTDGGGWYAVGDTTGTTLLLSTSDGRTAFRDGASYAFRVRCISADGSGYTSAVSAPVSLLFPAKPVLSSAVCEGKGVRLKWKKSAGVSRYRVFCKQGSGGWKKVLDTSSNKVLVKTRDGKNALVTGKTYRFTVRCLSDDGQYLVNSIGNSKSLVFVQGSSLTSVKNVKKQKLTLKWKRVQKVTGYQVQIAQNSAFTKGKKSVNVKGEKKLSASIGSLKKKTQYWVRVRCYRTVSGKKKWSGWSAAKSITVKK